MNNNLPRWMFVVIDACFHVCNETLKLIGVSLEPSYSELIQFHWSICVSN